MKDLFEPTTINGMQLENRFVRSATWEGMCDAQGRPTEKLVNCYKNLALGKVGLIITGYTFIRPEGRQLPGKMGLYSDDFEAEMKALVKEVHKAGGKICIQLVHAGGQTDHRNAGNQPVGPSSVKVDQFPETPRELSTEEIRELVIAFGNAARRAKSYGFDAVQIHGAHGYLVNQFLSPLTNRRADEYGGTIDNRCRFLMEVYHQIRKEVGPDYPVLIKLNASDNLSGGLGRNDALYAAKQLDLAGIDAIEVSAGTSASGGEKPVRTKIRLPEQEAYNLELARDIKEAVQCPVMVVGGVRSWETAEKAVQEYGMDYVALSRPLIMEPNLVERWQTGERAPSTCTSCNGCFVPGLKEGGIYCTIDKRK